MRAPSLHTPENSYISVAEQLHLRCAPLGLDLLMDSTSVLFAGRRGVVSRVWGTDTPTLRSPRACVSGEPALQGRCQPVCVLWLGRPGDRSRQGTRLNRTERGGRQRLASRGQLASGEPRATFRRTQKSCCTSVKEKMLVPAPASAPRGCRVLPARALPHSWHGRLSLLAAAPQQLGH